MYFRECPHCGCHLDPGERCDCKEELDMQVRLMHTEIFLEKETKQYRFKVKTQKQESMSA